MGAGKVNDYYIKEQRIQWFGHVTRRKENDPLRAAHEWGPRTKWPRERLEKRYSYGVEGDLDRLKAENWKVTVQDRGWLRVVAVAAKAPRN